MQATYSATCDFSVSLDAINEAFAARDFDRYNDLFDRYSDELDEFANKAFTWAVCHGTVALDIDSTDQYAGEYTLSPTGHCNAFGLTTTRDHGSYTIPLGGDGDLSDWLCYIDGTVTISCVVA